MKIAQEPKVKVLGFCTHSVLNVGFEAIYERVPRDTEILLTHTPPYGILDTASRGVHAGCQTLSTTLEGLGNCRMHVFGHIHEAHGAIIHEGGGRVSVNAAMAGGYGEAVIVDLMHNTNIT
jgi:Icc-related predicted phosphoesterase